MTTVTVNETTNTVTVTSDATSVVEVVAAGPKGSDGTSGSTPWSPPVAWASGQSYVVGPPASCVTNGGGSYVCTTAHTSGVSFDASKWIEICDPGNAQAAQDAQVAAEAARDLAQGYASSASSSAGTATTQAGIATTQAGNASTYATNASNSASAASTSAGNAATSETNAASSASTAFATVLRAMSFRL